MKDSDKVSGLTRELLDLNAQLESMGGGDAKISPLTVYVRVRPPREPSKGSHASCVALDGDLVRLMDPKAAESTLIESALRTFKVSCALPIHSNQFDVFSAVGNQALDHLWDGFSVAGVTLVPLVHTSLLFHLFVFHPLPLDRSTEFSGSFILP